MTLRVVEHVLIGPGRVLLVDVAPERVLEPVGAVEHAGDQPARDLVDRVEEHRLALPVHVEALLDELVVVDDVLVQAPRCLPPGRGSRTGLASWPGRPSTPTGSRPASPGVPDRC